MAPLDTGWRRGTHVRETRDGFDLRRYFIAIAKTSVKRRMRFIFANAAALDREFEQEK
jgi:hypothetical protein